MGILGGWKTVESRVPGNCLISKNGELRGDGQQHPQKSWLREGKEKTLKGTSSRKDPGDKESRKKRNDVAVTLGGIDGVRGNAAEGTVPIRKKRFLERTSKTHGGEDHSHISAGMRRDFVGKMVSIV